MLTEGWKLQGLLCHSSSASLVFCRTVLFTLSRNISVFAHKMVILFLAVYKLILLFSFAGFAYNVHFSATLKAKKIRLPFFFSNP